MFRSACPRVGVGVAVLCTGGGGGGVWEFGLGAGVGLSSLRVRHGLQCKYSNAQWDRSYLGRGRREGGVLIPGAMVSARWDHELSLAQGDVGGQAVASGMLRRIGLKWA